MTNDDRSWVRRHTGFVASTVVGAVLVSGVSFGYWYFGQRPGEEQTVRRAQVRDLYEDSRRLLTDVRETLRFIEHDYPSLKGLPDAKKSLRDATTTHNRAYGLMQREKYGEAVVAFRMAQDVIDQCDLCGGIAP